MSRHETTLVRGSNLWALFAALTAPSLLAQPPAANPTSAATTSGEAVVLSPFQVDANADKGYLATQTLSGTRLKTDLRDIGSALTIFTEEMMNDLAANNLNEVLAFAPNTDAFVNRLSDSTGTGNDFINVANQYVTRGGTTAVVGQDFFSTIILPDRYNSEAFTFTRGPNAILFGLGNPAGAFVSSTKRAKNRTATTVELQTDDRDSFRSALDHNQVIKKDLLALRYAGLYEKKMGFLIPSEGRQRRHFLTAQYTPFKTTILRVNYEQGHLIQPATRPWPVHDAVSPWLAAGSPLLATLGAARPAGIALYNGAGLVTTQLSPAGTQIPTMRWQGIQGQSEIASYGNGFPAASNKRSFVNPAVYPTFASAYGLSSYRQTDFKIYSVFIEQQIAKDFFIEAAINRVFNDAISPNGVQGGTDTLFADVNQKLPNGDANPNAGKLYTESQSTMLVVPSRSLNKRVMASYELDLTRRRSSWLRHFGRHRAAVFAEEVDSRSNGSNLLLQNTTPLVTTGAAAAIGNNANAIRFRYYYDPAAGKVGVPGGQAAFPILFANSPLPASKPNGVTPAYVSTITSAGNDSNIRTGALALQSLFWGDRLVLTNGLRTDKVRAWRAITADFAGLRDANGFYPAPAGFDLRRFVPSSLTERSGGTFTHGAVLHALPWLSFTYNTSNNFQPNSGTRNVFGDLLPNPQGRGSDYGVKLALLDRRLFFELTYYRNSTQDKIDGTVANSAAGNFKREIDAVWGAIADFTGDAKYRTAPYSDLINNNTWSDNAATTSSGWEFAATANLTQQWRLTINGSKRGNSTTTARGVNLVRYLEIYLPIMKATPRWQSLTGTNNQTVAQNVAQLETYLVNLKAVQDLPEDVFASSWTLNLIQTYSFAQASRFAGFSLGGSVNARGRSIDGFAENAANVFVPTQPYYAPGYETVGAWVTYRRKLFKDRIDWRLQLNVRNLFDAYTVSPLRTIDRRDGTHTGTTATYRLSEPRTFTLTSTFKF